MHRITVKILCCLSLICLGGCGASSEFEYSAKYLVDDNTEYSQKEYDDSAWSDYSDLGPLRIEKEAPFYYWIRIHFKGVSNTLNDPAIFLGYIGDVDEVYLNGKFIGQTGSLEGESKQYYHYPRLYRIPRDYLQDRNIISIRGKKLTVMTAGIYNGEIEIGEYKKLMKKRDSSFFWIKDLGLILAFFCMMMGFYHLFLYSKIPEHIHNLIYFIFSVFSSLMCFSLSWGFTNYFKNPITVIKLHTLIAIGTCLSYFTFFLFFLDVKNKVRFKYLYWINFLVAIYILISGDIYNVFNIFNVWYLLAFGMVVYAIWLLFREYQKFRKKTLKFLMISLLVLVVCVILDIFHGLGLGLNFQISGIGFLALNIGIMFSLAQDFTDAYLDQELAVQGRTKDLQIALSELKEVEKNKETFFSNITHDLKNPIAVITSAIEKILPSIPEKHEKTAKVALSTSLNLNSMVVNILDTAKAVDGNLDIKWQKIHIFEFYEQLCNEYEILAERKRLKFAHKYIGNKEEIMVTDPSKLKRVIDNLYSNAVKFTKQGIVGVKFTVLENQQITIEFEDSGEGIPIEERDKVFQRYYQGKKTDITTHGGSGIGLSFVQKVVDYMEGHIGIEDGKYGGSKFQVRLPLQPDNTKVYKEISSAKNQALPSISVKEEVPYPAKTPDQIIPQIASILVAEDDPNLAAAIQDTLKEQYNIFLAENGEEALSTLENNKIDLIISDVMMPIMDGKEFLQNVKNHRRWKVIPFLFLTSLGNEETVVELLEKGAQDHLTKPFTQVVLMARVKTNIENTTLKRDLTAKDRMASISLLSAAISHEIRNPIHSSSMITNSTAETIKKIYTLWRKKNHNEFEKYMNDSEMVIGGNLESISSSVKRLDQIVTNMTVPVISKKDIGEVVVKEYFCEVITTLQHKIDKKNITVHVEEKQPNIAVKAHNSLYQVFNNLVDNAISAVRKDEGNVWISIENINEDEVLIQIKDNGIGIDGDVLPYIFEPLFTTKMGGKGTGFGLFFARNIIERHSSKIEVNSAKGKGTTFLIFLQKTPDFSNKTVVKYKGMEI